MQDGAKFFRRIEIRFQGWHMKAAGLALILALQLEAFWNWSRDMEASASREFCLAQSGSWYTLAARISASIFWVRAIQLFHRKLAKYWKATFVFLDFDEFKERYVKGRRPVILTDIKPQLQWTPKNLSLRCGTMPVSFDRRYSAGLRAIPSWMRKLFLDSRTLLTYNHTTEHVLEAMHASTTLEEYVSRLDKDQNSISLAKKVTDGRLYSGNIADYIFPVMLSAQHIERGHCDDLISEGKAVLRRLIEFDTWTGCWCWFFAIQTTILPCIAHHANFSMVIPPWPRCATEDGEILFCASWLLINKEFSIPYLP